jgi:hypothetical protein
LDIQKSQDWLRESNPRRSSPRVVSLQYLAGGIILGTVCIGIGNMFGFSAVLLPQLQEEEGPIR